MSSANQSNPDEPGMLDPPAGPMPPAPDLQFVVPPTDPVGTPQQPVPPSGRVRRDGKRPSRAARLVALGFVLTILGGIALVVLFGS